jgi:hypothetical protein
MNNVSKLNFAGDEIWINSHEIPSADLVVETEMIDVTLLTKVEPDLKWTYVDARGHFHAFTHNGELPTLLVETIEHVSEDSTCDEDLWETWSERIMKCRICRDVIEPRYTETIPTWRETAPGRKSWTLTVRWPGDLLLPTPSELVSVRIKVSDREYFGIAMCTGRFNGASRELASVEFAGLADLGSRKLT